MDRGWWLVLSGVVSALVLLTPQAAGAQAPRVLRMSAFANDPLTTLARASGSMADAGLDVEVSITPNSTEQMQGLSDGTYDIVSTAFDNVLAWSGRADAEIVAVAQVNSSAVLPIVVRPEIGGWEDLRGKPLAVDAADTAFALVLRRVLRAHDLELERDYTFLPVGATAARLQALQDGRAFAAIMNAPFDAQAVAAGMRSFGDNRQVLPDYPGGVLAVRRDWAADNRDDLVTYLRIWRQAGQLAAAEPEAAAAVLAGQLNVPTPAARGMLPSQFNDGVVHEPGLQTVLDLRNLFGYQLPMGPLLETYIETTYYDAASATK